MKDLLAKFEAVRDPMRTAHFFGIEEIIDPRDTRPLACEVSLCASHGLPSGISAEFRRCAVDRSCL